MAKVLKDLSQLPRSSFKPSDPVKKPPPPKSPDDDARAVLAYFSKKGQTAEVPAEAQTDDGEAAKLKALEETIRKLTDAKEKAETRALIAEQNLAKTAVARTKAEDEVKRLQGECGRLQGEARKRAEAETRPEETAPATPIEAPPANGLFVLPKSFAELYYLKVLPRCSMVNSARWCWRRLQMPATQPNKVARPAAQRLSMPFWR